MIEQMITVSRALIHQFTELIGTVVMPLQPEVLLLLPVFYATLIIWPLSLARHIARDGATPPIFGVDNLARVPVWIGVLLHSSLLMLIILVPDLRLWRGLEYPFTRSTPYLILNWSLIITTLLGLIGAIVAVTRRWWKPISRIHFAVVTFCLLINLGFFHLR